MEIVSFVLGMSLVVVIAIAVVAVIGFVKARKIEGELNDITQDLYRQSDIRETGICRRVDDLETNVFSQLDSRLDKLESKVMDTIKNGCEPVKQKLTNNK